MKYKLLTVKNDELIGVIDLETCVSFRMGPEGFLYPKIEPRSEGPFKSRALWLDRAFDWILGEDSSGATILLCVKRTKEV